MALGQHKRAIGVFSNRRDAEVALRELRDSRFPMDRVSVITQDADQQGDMSGADVRDRAGNKADEGAAIGAMSGGAVGGVTGLLVGLGTLLLPGIGPIMLAGATATAIATTLAGGAIGAVAGSLLGALIGLGIPEERARAYNERVSRGHYLIMVEGTDDEIRHAEGILHGQGIEDWGIYDMPNAEAATMRRHRAVGVFPHRREAQDALAELRDSGFSMGQVSLVARDYDRNHGIAGLDVRDRLDNTRYGFPNERVRFYDDRVNRGEYLVMVHGTSDEIRRAEAILSRRGIQDWRLFDAPEVVHSRTDYQSTPRSALVRNKRAVGVFSHRRDAEAALTDLRTAGFDMNQVSVVGKDANDASRLAGGNVADRTKTGEGAATGAATGGALGGLGGLLVGLGALAIPGIGPVLAGGALATALATAAAGGAIGAAAGGLTGALVGLGIPDKRAKLYNDRVNHGDYLVMVDGSEDEVHRAEAIFRRHGIQEWDIFDAPDADKSRPGNVAAATDTPRRDTGRTRRGVGVFPHRRDAEAALTDLRGAGFNMDHVSVVGKHAHGNDQIAGVEMGNRAEGNKADDGAKAGAATGGVLGGLGGLLVGLGALAIPGIGPVVAGGALATALATTAAGGAIGAAAGGITGALVGLGIPEEQAKRYNDRVNRGDYLVMVDGTEDELRRAEPILSRHGIHEWGIYDKSDVAAGDSGKSTSERDRTVYTTATPVATVTPAATVTPTAQRTSYTRHRAIGVFPHHRDVEVALGELRDAGFDMNQVSVVGKDLNGTGAVSGGTGAVGGDVTDRTKTDEGAKTGAATGGALGGLGGLLVGLGALAIPGIGPVLAGGALATALATAAAGGAIGAAAGGLTGALVGLGIPDEKAHLYNDRVNRGDYLVMVDGTEQEIRRAEAILSRRGIQDWAIFDAPDTDKTRAVNATPTTATRQVIAHDTTPGVRTTPDHAEVVSKEPEVIIIDRRDQSL